MFRLGWIGNRYTWSIWHAILWIIVIVNQKQYRSNVWLPLNSLFMFLTVSREGIGFVTFIRFLRKVLLCECYLYLNSDFFSVSVLFVRLWPNHFKNSVPITALKFLWCVQELKIGLGIFVRERHFYINKNWQFFADMEMKL